MKEALASLDTNYRSFLNHKSSIQMIDLTRIAPQCTVCTTNDGEHSSALYLSDSYIEGALHARRILSKSSLSSRRCFLRKNFARIYVPYTQSNGYFKSCRPLVLFLKLSNPKAGQGYHGSWFCGFSSYTMDNYSPSLPNWRCKDHKICASRSLVWLRIPALFLRGKCNKFQVVFCHSFSSWTFC